MFTSCRQVVLPIRLISSSACFALHLPSVNREGPREISVINQEHERPLFRLFLIKKSRANYRTGKIQPRRNYCRKTC